MHQYGEPNVPHVSAPHGTAVQDTHLILRGNIVIRTSYGVWKYGHIWVFGTIVGSDYYAYGMPPRKYVARNRNTGLGRAFQFGKKKRENRDAFYISSTAQRLPKSHHFAANLSLTLQMFLTFPSKSGTSTAVHDTQQKTKQNTRDRGWFS